MNDNNTIKCPQCGLVIDVNELLSHQIQDRIEKENVQKIKYLQSEFEQKQKELDVEKARLLKEKADIETSIAHQVQQQIVSERAKLSKSLKVQLESEHSESMKMMKAELDAKSEQVKELNKYKAEIERLIREKEELKDSITLEKERELTEKLEQEKAKIKKQAEESSEMKIREMEKKLEDQKKLAEEMKRKAEQGSMQLQGEVQELAIEDILNSLFPFDVIKDVPKGVKGADVIHTVRNKLGADCGVILYESKRTKSFNHEWIIKLKSDAVLVKADLCILVSEVLPESVDKVGLIDGVWVCTYQDFKSLVLVIRENVIKISEAYATQTNTGEKMQMLYNYLTSNEFILQIGAIVDGFSDLQRSYIQEKNAMERIWKQREKQLAKVLLNTNSFIGSVKGIAGISVQAVKEIGSVVTILDQIE